MKKPAVIHPFLLALFPILALFSYNIKQVSFAQTLLPAVTVLSLTILLLLLFRWALRNYEKSAIFVSFFLILFFSFGHIREAERLLAIHSRGNLEFALVILMLIIFYFFTAKRMRNLDNLTKILNIIAASLVTMSAGYIVSYKLEARPIRIENKSIEFSPANFDKTEKLPNIYYIILDGHARGDVLEEIYHYDNTEFIDYLIKKGFYVADKSTANYAQSVLSLPSSLNSQYVDKLITKIDTQSSDWWPLFYIWRKNRAFRFLKKYGYATVTFDAQGWNDYLTKRDVDILYSTPRLGAMDGFQSELLETTPIPYILTGLLKRPALRYDFLRKRILHAFDKLEEISKLEGPFFVFAHLLTPHQPFIFGEHGEYITPKMARYTEWYSIPQGRNRSEYIEDYKKQVSFIDRKTQLVIDKILSNSPVAPIIILQSDHGPDANLDPESVEKTDHWEKMGILNAYYFPDHDYRQLYKEITPVNTFRIIFNHFFGTNYELLEDKNYFSPWSKPYKFFDVTARVKSSLKTKQ